MKRRFVISAVCFFAYLLIPGACSNPNDSGAKENPEYQENPAKQKDPGTKETPAHPGEEQDEPGYEENPDGSVTVTGAKALTAWLADQDDNTETEPYRIRVKGFDLTSGVTKGDTLKTLYDALNRYVNLDLSDCTGKFFTSITPAKAPHKAYITGILLPGEVKTINTNAFAGCTAMTVVSMPGVTTIEPGAFKECAKLEIASMEEVVEIKNTGANGNAAFTKCASLTGVYLPKVMKIGAKTFEGCPGIESLVFGANPPELGADVFPVDKKTGGLLASNLKIFIPASTLSTYQNDTGNTGWTAALKAKLIEQPEGI